MIGDRDSEQLLAEVVSSAREEQRQLNAADVSGAAFAEMTTREVDDMAEYIGARFSPRGARQRVIGLRDSRRLVLGPLLLAAGVVAFMWLRQPSAPEPSASVTASPTAPLGAAGPIAAAPRPPNVGAVDANIQLAEPPDSNARVRTDVALTWRVTASVEAPSSDAIASEAPSTRSMLGISLCCERLQPLPVRTGGVIRLDIEAPANSAVEVAHQSESGSWDPIFIGNVLSDTTSAVAFIPITAATNETTLVFVGPPDAVAAARNGDQDAAMHQVKVIKVLHVR